MPTSRASDALCLPTPDWLAHRLVVTGPADEVAAFQAAAAGPGLIPWHLRAPELQEGWFTQLVAPLPERRGITVEGAHVLAGQLADAVQALHAETVAGAPGRDCVVPLDLHALVPVPAELLAFGPEAPEAEAWLWERWGTTWPLRGVAEETSSAVLQRGLPVGRAMAAYRFHSADWSPWQALLHVRARWPELRFDLRPEYGLVEPGAAAPARRRGGTA